MRVIYNKNKADKTFVAKRKLLCGDDIIPRHGFTITDKGVDAIRIYSKFSAKVLGNYPLGKRSLSFIICDCETSENTTRTEDLMIVRAMDGTWFVKIIDGIVVFVLNHESPSVDWNLKDGILYTDDFIVELSSYTLEDCEFKLSVEELGKCDY